MKYNNNGNGIEYSSDSVNDYAYFGIFIDGDMNQEESSYVINNVSSLNKDGYEHYCDETINILGVKAIVYSFYKPKALTK